MTKEKLNLIETLDSHFWVTFCADLNTNGNSIWTLMYWNGMIIGVKKIGDRPE